MPTKKLSPPKRAKKIPKAPSKLEAQFDVAWRALCLKSDKHFAFARYRLVAEHHFDSVRKYRLDFVHLPTLIAIEIDGGIGAKYAHGGHATGRGITRDHEKDFLAITLGYTVIRLTAAMIDEKHLLDIMALIDHRLEHSWKP